MRFKVQREDLLTALQPLVSIVEKRQTMAVLNNILIETDDEKLRLTSTDNEVELVANVSATIEEPGTSTLAARKWLDICRNLPEQSLLDLVVEGSRTILKSGRSRFTLATMPHDHFPRLESIGDAESVTVSPRELKRLIEHTHFSMANQDVRYFLNGLLLELTGKGARAVATDGHRLALAESENSINAHQPYQVIVPRKGVQELLRLLQDSDVPALLQLSKNHIRIELDSIRMTSKLIEGNFPDYNSVFPSKADKTIIVNRDELRRAISRVVILSSEKSRGIRLVAQGDTLQIGSQNQEHEEAEEELEIEYGGELVEIGFNGSYILDVLGSMDAQRAEIALQDSSSSGLFKAEGDDTAKHVIMPMRL